MFKEKHLHQRIIYPIGNALVRAIFIGVVLLLLLPQQAKQTAKKAQQ
jgi:hypothetical protein